jgi:hypothetical protein
MGIIAWHGMDGGYANSADCVIYRPSGEYDACMHGFG